MWEHVVSGGESQVFLIAEYYYYYCLCKCNINDIIMKENVTLVELC